jgi:hypothetical protein
LPVVKRSESAERDPEEPVSSRLDRAGLQRIAAVSHGEYFELDRDGDRHIANEIVDAGKRLAPTLGTAVEAQELYWWFLAAAGIVAAAGLFFVRDRAELWIQLVGAAAVLIGVYQILG